jgi:hypothetical protein
MFCEPAGWRFSRSRAASGRDMATLLSDISTPNGTFASTHSVSSTYRGDGEKHLIEHLSTSAAPAYSDRWTAVARARHDDTSSTPNPNNGAAHAAIGRCFQPSPSPENDCLKSAQCSEVQCGSLSDMALNRPGTKRSRESLIVSMCFPFSVSIRQMLH